MGANDWYSIWSFITFQFSSLLNAKVSVFCRFLSLIIIKFTTNLIETMPATRSRTSTEAPEVAVDDKKTDVTEEQPQKEAEVKEVVTEDKTDSNSAEQSSDSTSADEKPVEKSEDNTNGSTDALPSDTNGDKKEVENGSAKRKSTGDEAGDAPDSTDITPKKAKVAAIDDNNGTKETGAGEEAEKKTSVETTA